MLESSEARVIRLQNVIVKSCQLQPCPSLTPSYLLKLTMVQDIGDSTQERSKGTDSVIVPLKDSGREKAFSAAMFRNALVMSKESRRHDVKRNLIHDVKRSWLHMTDDEVPSRKVQRYKTI